MERCQGDDKVKVCLSSVWLFRLMRQNGQWNYNSMFQLSLNIKQIPRNVNINNKMSFYGISSSECDRLAEDAYSSMAPDPAFALSEVRVALHSILYMFFWIMITFDTMLTSPFYIHMSHVAHLVLV